MLQEDGYNASNIVIQTLAEAQDIIKNYSIDSDKNTCPDCNDHGWLYNEDGSKFRTCPCHYH